MGRRSAEQGVTFIILFHLYTGSWEVEHNEGVCCATCITKNHFNSTVNYD
jgi:hypothetical protein